MKRISLLSTFWLLLVFQTVVGQSITTPPPYSVRTMAEWEEVQALTISWRQGSGGASWLNILTEIVRAAQTECRVIILCDSQTDLNSARNHLTSKGINVDFNIELVVIPVDSIWIRDFGATSIYAGQVDSLLLVDWIYNRQRPKDNNAPLSLGSLLQMPVFSTSTAPYDLVNTGGNFMTDGMGTAFASKLIFRNNDQIMNGEGSNINDLFGTSDHTESEIDNIMEEFMGIHRYIKMNELPYDGIHHIDMHMKLLDEETLLVGQYPSGISDGPQIEANLQYVLSQFVTPFNRPYKVIRIPMPPFSGAYPPFSVNGRYPTYANALFVNRTVIMPSYNNPKDQEAQDTLRKYLPGYKIVPVNCTAIIDYGGAVHCITKELGVLDPLLIQHGVLTCQDNSSSNGYEVRALINHRSGIAQAWIHYSSGSGQPWQLVEMHPAVGGALNEWAGQIPEQAAGSTVQYYIEATANNGKNMTRPITAPEGSWSFCTYDSSDANAPESVKLESIYPNPASAITVIPVTCAKKCRVELSLYHITGQQAAVIFSGDQESGSVNYFFDAGKFPSGVYQVELRAGDQSMTRKIVIR